MKRISLLVILLFLLFINTAWAQYASQSNAANLIIAKVVADYKMNDEEYAADIAALRENQKFNDKLQRMLEKISNSTTGKDAKSKQIDKILRKAGGDIERILGVR